ncbi:hypothetical protein BJX76DRAFT_134425 [Aspergillus varians]
MPQPSLHQSPLKEGRRILGEKTANACLSPARSPAKQTLFNSTSPKKLLPSPSFIAQKRSIGQADAENAAPRLSVQGQRVETQPAHHEASARSIVDPDSRPESASTSKSDAMKLDAPEQTQPSQQQSIPKTNPPQNTAQTTSKEPELDSTSTPQSIPSDPKTRKVFIQKKASLLRNRLQNAMRHVRDPQFDRRLSELEEHSRKYPRLSRSGSGSGAQLQKHLEQKYGTDEQEVEDEEESDEEMLSTPRAPAQNQPPEEQREIIHISDGEDGETTPTQDNVIQRTGVNVEDNGLASPTQMLLSSPTYNNSTVQTGRFDDDRPRAREATVATSPSSSQRGEGDGDAVDGLLKLMGTNTRPATTTSMGADTGARV